MEQVLLKEDLLWCLRRMPNQVVTMLKQRGDKVVVAGGFIRACIAGEKPSDIDLFTNTPETAEACAREMKDKTKRRMVTTNNAYTIYECGRLSIQFIHKWTFERPRQIIPSFDFTIAKAAIWYDTDNKEYVGICDERFYPDLAAKRLVYCSPKRIEEAGGSMLRVLKFYQCGYRIPLDSLGAVIARCMTGINLERKCPDHLTKEEDWAYILSGLLREVDPAIDPTHSAHLPSLTERIDDGEKEEEDKEKA